MIRIVVVIQEGEQHEEGSIELTGLGAELLLEDVLPQVVKRSPPLRELPRASALSRIVAEALRDLTRRTAKLWEV